MSRFSIWKPDIQKGAFNQTRKQENVAIEEDHILPVAPASKFHASASYTCHTIHFQSADDDNRERKRLEA